MKLTLMESICCTYLLPKNSSAYKKLLYFEKGKNVLNSKLDILFMINKFNELDKLKFLLLSKEQASLFHLIPDQNLKK